MTWKEYHKDQRERLQLLGLPRSTAYRWTRQDIEAETRNLGFVPLDTEEVEERDDGMYCRGVRFVGYIAVKPVNDVLLDILP